MYPIVRGGKSHVLSTGNHHQNFGDFRGTSGFPPWFDVRAGSRLAKNEGTNLIFPVFCVLCGKFLDSTVCDSIELRDTPILVLLSAFSVFSVFSGK
jgi:hypothetical protein